MAMYTFTILMTPGGNSSPRLRRSIFSWKCSSRSLSSFSKSLRSVLTSSVPFSIGISPQCLRGTSSSCASSSTTPLFKSTLPLSSTSSPLVVLPPSTLLIFDRLRALVLFRAFARENPSVDHDTGHAWRDLERAVAHVAGLFAEDRAEQLLFRGELALTLRSDLADQDVARLHLGANAHHARVVEVLEGLFADVRDVLGDLFLAQLRVARDALELLDVNRGVDVLLGDALADEDRVFEVVALPGHERDDHVLTERELTHVRRRTVGKHVTLLHVFARADDRLLVVAGALVGALVLGQVIDVRHLITLTRDGADDDAFGIDALDHAITPRDDTHAGVDRNATFHRGADERRFRAYERHGLALHVGAHECAVRVVVLQEGHERRGDAHHLVRRDVHQLD